MVGIQKQGSFKRENRLTALKKYRRNIQEYGIFFADKFKKKYGFLIT